MDLDVRYHGRSGIRRIADGFAVSLSPNLRRDKISFVGTLKSPLRFREAVSALNDVISDLRVVPKHKSTYEAIVRGFCLDVSMRRTRTVPTGVLLTEGQFHRSLGQSRRSRRRPRDAWI